MTEEPAAALACLDGTFVWTMRSNGDRFTGAFDDRCRTIRGPLEALDDESNWNHWMDITLTKAS